MDPKFKFKTVMTKKLLYEFCFSALFGKLYLILASIAILSGIVLIALGDSTDIAFYIALPIILIIFGFLLPHLQAKQIYEQKKITNSGKEPAIAEYRFYDDKVVGYEEIINLTTDYFYWDFNKHKKTKNLYLIKFKHNIYLMLEKNNFEIGTAEEFEAFIKEKIKK